MTAADDNARLFDEATAHAKAGDHATAARLYERLVQSHPQSAAAHDGLGLALHHLGRREAADEAYRTALKLDPSLAGVWFRLGLLEAEAGRFEDAEAAYDAALRLSPRYLAARANRAEVRLRRGDPAAAVADFDLAIAAAPREPGIAFNAALAHMMLGEWSKGLALYEARRALDPTIGRRMEGSVPEWRGGPLDGVRLRVHAEQGYGDTIQFSRFARLAAERGAQVTLLAPARLLRLLDGLGSGVIVVDEAKAPPPADAQALLMSLPLRLEVDPTTWSPAIPYLTADPVRVARWAARIGADGIRVGVVWQGDPNTWNDAGRSIPPEALAALGDLAGVRLFSLQKGAAADAASGLPIAGLGPDFDSGPDGFLDTAAAIMSLDVVIACDTSVAHLAGALGRPVWVLLSSGADWRWELRREDTVWYPSMRLFRQSRRGDWSEPLARVTAALDALRP